jgi:hypothetical protein
MSTGNVKKITFLGRKVRPVHGGWQPYPHLWADCVNYVGFLTSHNSIVLHGYGESFFSFYFTLVFELCVAFSGNTGVMQIVNFGPIILSIWQVLWSHVAVMPLDVRILGASQPLSEGRRYDLLCQSSGSRPPASITWKLDGKRLKGTKETVSGPLALFLHSECGTKTPPQFYCHPHKRLAVSASKQPWLARVGSCFGFVSADAATRTDMCSNNRECWTTLYGFWIWNGGPACPYRMCGFLRQM